jgi:hypothetical protein
VDPSGRRLGDAGQRGGPVAWQGSSGGGLVAIAAADWWADGFFFDFFYIFQKYLPSVCFTHGKLFAECPKKGTQSLLRR